jgi:hypothetical protein
MSVEAAPTLGSEFPLSFEAELHQFHDPGLRVGVRLNVALGRLGSGPIKFS